MTLLKTYLKTRIATKVYTVVKKTDDDDDVGIDQVSKCGANLNYV